VVDPINKRRWVINFIGLNLITITYVFPAPSVAEAMFYLQGANFFTILALQSAYYQCALNPDDKPKTTFAAAGRLYQFTVVPFGLKGAPAYFQRHIARTFEDIEHVFAYLDDICVATDSLKEHTSIFLRVLQRIYDTNLRLKASKCKVAVSTMTYAYRGGHAPDPDKIASLLDRSSPKDAKQLRAFLGMAGYYHSYILNFASTADRLYQLIRNNIKWEWSDDSEQAMRNLIEAIESQPILEYPNNDKNFCDIR
jgi:hypothetical protein